MSRSRMKTLAVTSAVVAGLAAAPAFAAESYKLGIVTFLSGAAAGPFGVPAENAAKLVVEALNAGTMPAPYTTKGFGDKTVEMTFVDEAGGGTKQVAEFRNLVERQGVDAVIGYISSGDCLAVPSAAEELKKLLVLFALDLDEFDFVLRLRLK